MKYRIMIADDHELVRLGVRTFLEQYPDLLICCEAGNGQQAIEKASQYHPDITIMDIGMPLTNGIVATIRILKEFPRQKIVMFTVPESEETIRAALQTGIRGLVFKTDPLSHLHDAIAAIAANRTFFTAQVENLILGGYLHRTKEGSQAEPANGPRLTLRESETLQLIAEGRSTKEIAMCLGLAVKTAETHRSRVLRKLGVNNATKLTLYAIRHNIVEVPVFDPLISTHKFVAGATS